MEWLPQLNTFVCQAEAKARLKVARKVSQEAAEEAGSSDRNLHPLATSTIRVHTPKNQLLVLHREAKANAAEEAKREAAQQVRQGRGFGEFRQCSRGIISVLPMPAALRFASSFARHLPKPLSCQDKRSQVTAVGHQMTPDFHGKVMRHNARHVPLACSYGCIQVVHIQSCIFGIDRH